MTENESVTAGLLPSLEGMTLLHTADEALERFHLVCGTGNRESTACVMTALSWMTGAAWSDSPPCAHSTLRDLAVSANDAPGTTAGQRAEILRLGETGLVDTWWVPSSVIAAALARPGAAGPYPPEVVALLDAAWLDPKARQTIIADHAEAVAAWVAEHEVPSETMVERALRVLAAISAWKELGRPRADLRRADLRRAYLQGAYLRRAYLRRAYLQGAYLQGADLQGADLQGADLQGAYLQGAYLQGAYLQGADLQGAYLQGADLQGAYLQGAYADKLTVLPEGWCLDEATGLVVRPSEVQQ